MNWNIITDSSCDLEVLDYSNENNENQVDYTSVPFIISIGDKDYIDDGSFEISNLLDDMEASSDACRTSCPSSGLWLSEFEKVGHTIAITISKELSGSFNSAMAAKSMLEEKITDKKIAVINSISAGPGLSLIVDSIVQSIRENKTFEEVVAIAQKVNEEKETIFALSSFNNLVKAGRMSPILGFVAKTLHFWGIGVASKIGTIEIKGKVRGAKKAIGMIVKDILEKNNEVKKVFISHCENLELAELLKTELQKVVPSVQVVINETKGLCSFYAERHGLIVSYI